jgi:hypothetical protein
LFPDRFKVKTIPIKAKKGVEKLPLKNWVRGPVCWAKMVHVWKPWRHTFWPSPECQKPFNMLSRQALSSIMVWIAGDGPWWAPAAEILKKQEYVLSCLATNPTWPDEFVASILKIMTISPQEEPFQAMSSSCSKAFFTAHRKNQLGNPCILPKALNFTTSHAKGGLKPDLHPWPPDLNQKVPNIIADTLGKLMVPGRSFWKSTFWQGFPPISTLPTWATPATSWVCRGA